MYLHVCHVYCYVCVQCEDAAVNSVRSRNAEPPSPESLRRREEALYVDSRCVCECACVCVSAFLFSVCHCVLMYSKVH